MGIVASYDTTDTYRQKLIAERERIGSWDVSRMDPVAIPMFQFDNWDIKPLHAVKVDGKEMPNVNGSLLQAYARKRNNSESNSIGREEKDSVRHSGIPRPFMVVGTTLPKVFPQKNTK